MTKQSETFDLPPVTTVITKIAVTAVCLMIFIFFLTYFIEKLSDKDSEIVKERVEDLKRQIDNSQMLADSFARSADEVALTRKTIQAQIQVIDAELIKAEARDEKIADSIKDVKNSYEAARNAKQTREPASFQILQIPQMEAKNNNAKPLNKNVTARNRTVNVSLSERERRALSTDKRLYAKDANNSNDSDNDESVITTD